MDCALVIKWLKAYPRQEAQAGEVLTGLRTYFTKAAARGEVWEPLVLTQVDQGLFLVRGQLEILFDLTGRDDFISLLDQATYACEGFGFHVYFIDVDEEGFTPYGKAGRELT